MMARQPIRPSQAMAYLVVSENRAMSLRTIDHDGREVVVALSPIRALQLAVELTQEAARRLG